VVLATLPPSIADRVPGVDFAVFAVLFFGVHSKLTESIRRFGKRAIPANAPLCPLCVWLAEDTVAAERILHKDAQFW